MPAPSFRGKSYLGATVERPANREKYRRPNVSAIPTIACRLHNPQKANRDLLMFRVLSDP